MQVAARYLATAINFAAMEITNASNSDNYVIYRKEKEEDDEIRFPALIQNNF